MHIFSFHFLEKRFVLDPPIPPPPSHPLARRHARAAQASSALPPPLLHRMNRDIDAHAARRAYTFLYVRQSIVHTFRFPSLVERAHIPRESISACFSAPSHPSFPSSTISYSSFSVPLASCLAHRTSRLAPPRSATRQLINSLAHCPPHPRSPTSSRALFNFLSLPPFLPNRRPSPSPPPRSFVLALRLFVLLPSFQREEAIPLHLAGILFLFPFRPHLPLLRYHYCIALVVLAIRLW